MTALNPYAPPTHERAAPGTGGPGMHGVRLSGGVLICDKGTRLPALCLYSGVPVSGPPIQKKLTWVPQWCILILAFSPLIGLIIYLFVKKSGTLSYTLSPAALERRQQAVTFGLAATGLCVAGWVVGLNYGPDWLPMLGILAFLIGLLVAIVRSRLFTIAKIDEATVHLKLRKEATAAFERFLSAAPRA